MTRPSPALGGAAREEFMSRVRAALERREASESPAPPDSCDEIVRQVAADGDLPTEFDARAAELGLHIVHAATAAEVAPTIETILRRHDAARVALSRNLPQSANSLPETLAARGFAIVSWDEATGLSPLFDADAGITEAEAGLADCGAVACRSSPAHARGLSLAPPLHIALLPRSAILPDLLDFWRSAAERDIAVRSSAVVLIAGPSKTADIEGVLVTGVHGPRDVYVVVLDGD